ncbi:hypothetical protein FOA52_013598 [Chlamydomonas sp. UWO 241]|nr:hypothetical protein FOA52_013598 [Chlamydomonas sp. UWO 241]
MPGVYDSLEIVEGVGIGDAGYKEPLSLGPPGVCHGKLENGLTYYVCQCARPKERIAIGLAVRVGSVAEREEEQGVAHILEHLAFNATERYSNHDIVKFLESIGADFGACQNAYTSADETVFELVVPSEPAGLLEQAIGVLAEFAFSIRCAQEDIEKERGAVMEEWRMGRDAAGRSQEAHWKLIMEGSQYADRLPIGTEAVIKGVGSDTVRGFFDRWYRPEEMAVVVVGDLAGGAAGCAAVVETITRLLGSTPRGGRAGPSPPPMPKFSYAPHEEPRCKVMVDREAADSSVLVSFKTVREESLTPEEYVDGLLDIVFESCLGNRLYKLSRDADAPPFISACVGKDPLTSTVQSNTLSASAMEGGALRALECLLTEVARVRLHGFDAREIERALLSVRSNVESMFIERENDYCQDLRDELLRHFLNGEAVLGPEMEARLSKTLLHHVTKEAVDAKASAMRPSCSCVVKVVEHQSHCSDEDLASVVKRVAAAEASGDIGPWVEDAVPEHLIAPGALPPAGSVVSTRTFGGALGEVLITGFARGGLSEVSADRLVSARMATDIAEPLGVCGLKPSVLSDVLAGKRVGLGISDGGAFSRSFRGVQSPADIEVALQLCHLLFKTRLEVDEKELVQVMRLARQSVEAQLRDPRYYYTKRVLQINSGGHAFFAPTTMADLDAVDAAVALDYHNANYVNPAEFTVVLTGNLDSTTLVPLLCQYLGCIPAVDLPVPRKLQDVTPLQVTFPQGRVVEDVQVAMVNSLTQTQITLPATVPRADILRQSFMLLLGCRLLETRLMQRMRFKAGGIYTVQVSPTFGHDAPSNTGDAVGQLCIAFSCDPGARAKLSQMALTELAKLQDKGPSTAELSTIANLERIQFENNQQENDYWHEVLVGGYQSRLFDACRNVQQVYERRLVARTEVLASLSTATMRASLRALLPFPCDARCTIISMVPDGSGEGGDEGEDEGEEEGEEPEGTGGGPPSPVASPRTRRAKPPAVAASGGAAPTAGTGAAGAGAGSRKRSTRASGGGATPEAVPGSSKRCKAGAPKEHGEPDAAAAPAPKAAPKAAAPVAKAKAASKPQVDAKPKVAAKPTAAAKATKAAAASPKASSAPAAPAATKAGGAAAGGKDKSKSVPAKAQAKVKPAAVEASGRSGRRR